MTLPHIDLKKRLRELELKGFVRTRRVGDTGIGQTLERSIGLRETNKSGEPDLIYKEFPVELKSQRRATKSRITLFTKEPQKPILKDRDLIKQYGYIDKKRRMALKVTLTTNAFVAQGLKLRINERHSTLTIVDRSSRKLWYWTTQDMAQKIGNLCVVIADSKGSKNREMFHYNEAYLLTGLKFERLLNLFVTSGIVVEPRLHIASNGTVRNRGTAFRIKNLKLLTTCYRNCERLL